MLIHCSTKKTTQRTPSLPHYREELGAGRCHANLEIPKQRNSNHRHESRLAQARQLSVCHSSRVKSGHKSMQ